MFSFIGEQAINKSRFSEVGKEKKKKKLITENFCCKIKNSFKNVVKSYFIAVKINE